MLNRTWLAAALLACAALAATVWAVRYASQSGWRYQLVRHHSPEPDHKKLYLRWQQRPGTAPEADGGPWA